MSSIESPRGVERMTEADRVRDLLMQIRQPEVLSGLSAECKA